MNMNFTNFNADDKDFIDEHELNESLEFNQFLTQMEKFNSYWVICKFLRLLCVLLFCNDFHK